jgi:hypothetical protein
LFPGTIGKVGSEKLELGNGVGFRLAPVNAWRLPSWQAFESLKLEIVNGVE